MLNTNYLIPTTKFKTTYITRRKTVVFPIPLTHKHARAHTQASSTEDRNKERVTWQLRKSGRF